MWGSVKRMLFWGLMAAAFVVALTTWMGDHESDFGSLNLPPGGTIELPKGHVEVFFNEGAPTAERNRLAAPLTFQITPAAGGAALADTDTPEQASDTQTQRSEDVISRGSVAKYDVPEEGNYVVSGGSAANPGVLTFGTDPFHAVMRKWHLWGGLIGAAVLLSLLPTPRTRRTPDAGWVAGDSYSRG